MASGREATKRLNCGGADQGPTDNDGPATEWIPNCLAGATTPYDATLVTSLGGLAYGSANGDVDTTDFALEMWVRRLYPDSISNWQTAVAATTGYCVTGVTESPGAGGGNHGSGVTTPGAGLQIRGAAFEAFYQNTSYVSVTCVVPMGWHHVAINYDRSGNMQAFVDGVSQGTAAINATSLAGCSLVALYCALTNAQTASGKVHIPYLLSALAIHDNALLTNAQIENSVRGYSVNNLGGTTTALAMVVADTRLVESRGWTGETSITPTSADASASKWTSVRTALGTITAELSTSVYQLERVGTALPDSNSWGIGGASEGVASGYCPNQNSAAGITHRGVIFHCVFEDEDGAEDRVSGLSPAFTHDPTWPPKGGSSGVSYA